MEEQTVHFGKVDNKLPDWREHDIRSEDEDNDEDYPIERDVKIILGFDPDKIK